jgi:hypothetical protein
MNVDKKHHLTTRALERKVSYLAQRRKKGVWVYPDLQIFVL